jgi:hypothetical protein
MAAALGYNHMHNDDWPVSELPSNITYELTQGCHLCQLQQEELGPWS